MWKRLGLLELPLTIIDRRWKPDDELLAEGYDSLQHNSRPNNMWWSFC